MEKRPTITSEDVAKAKKFLDSKGLPTSGYLQILKNFHKSESENKIEYHFRLFKESHTGVYEFNEACFWAMGKFFVLFRCYMNISELESLKGRVSSRDWVYGVESIIKMHNDLRSIYKDTQLEPKNLIRKANEVLTDFERIRYCLEGISRFGTRDSKDINIDKRIASLMIEGLDMLISDIKTNISDLTNMGDIVSDNSEYIKKQQYIFQYRLKLSMDVMPVLNKYCSQIINIYNPQSEVTVSQVKL